MEKECKSLSGLLNCQQYNANKMMMNNLPDTPDLRILLIKLRHHGDMLLTTPSLIRYVKNGRRHRLMCCCMKKPAICSPHAAISTVRIDRKWKQLGTLKHLQKSGSCSVR